MEKAVSLSESGLGEPGRGMEVLIMTIEVGDGRKGTITIHENDTPEALASNFASQYAIPEALEKNLVSLIRSNKEQAEARIAQTSPDLQTSSVSSKPKKTSSFKPSKRTKSSTVLNYGQWLYAKGQELRESQAKYVQNKRNERDEKLANEVYTFRPLINEYSNLLSPRYFEKTEDLLLRQSANYQDKLKERQNKALAEEKKHCTFKPKLGAQTRKLAKSISIPKHVALHSEAEDRKKRREMISEAAFKGNYSFIPNEKNKKMTFEEQEKFADTLIKSKDDKYERRDKLIQESVDSLLKNNGNPLFRPKTGKSPVKERQPDVHGHLYSMRNDKKHRIQNSCEIHQQTAYSKANSSKISANSSKIFEQFRGKQYGKLFNLLDSDNDGQISYELISIEGISDTALSLLMPLFNTLNEGTTVDINRFVDIMETIWPGLTPEERAALMKREEKTKESSNNDKKGISSFSYKLANDRFSMFSADTYERLKHAQMLVDMRKQKLREISDQVNMKECTFRPKILKYKPS